MPKSQQKEKIVKKKQSVIRGPRAPKVKGVVKDKKRRVSRRSIIRGPKTAWIYFCNERRPEILKSDPTLSFGDVCKQLAPLWSQLSDEMKQPYVEKHVSDKARFVMESQDLSTDQKKILKQHKKRKRAEKKDKPKSPLSPYMFFVINERATIVTDHPTASFMEVGKILGDKWNSMNDISKEPYRKLSKDDKGRYDTEYQLFTLNKEKNEKENK
jgi:hypothetical protein